VIQCAIVTGIVNQLWQAQCVRNEVWVAVSLFCCHQPAAQDVFVSIPLLTHLIIDQQLTEQNAQMLAAVRLDTLRSLDVRMDLCHAWFLKGCTQLRTLTCLSSNIKGASAIAQLTGLTQLELRSAYPGQQLFSAAEQSELGSTLAALSNLQSLQISHAPPGPVTHALSQLTGLTELWLTQQELVVDPTPLILPRCVKLTLYPETRVHHLGSIDAPQLRNLDVSLALKPNDLDVLRRVGMGVLKACTSLAIHLMDEAWSKEDTVALMAALSQDWQPSAQALQPVKSNSIGPERSSISSWSLQLWHTHVSRQCLELLPKGLGCLHLG
jgi:hypothetical protein